MGRTPAGNSQKKQISGEKKRLAKQAMEQSHALDGAARSCSGANAKWKRRVLPQEIPQIPGYQIAGAWQPRESLAEITTTFCRLTTTRSGYASRMWRSKRNAGGVLMSNFQASVRGFASPSLSPDALCEKLGKLVCRNIAADRFITFVYAHLHGPSRRLLYECRSQCPDRAPSRWL